MGVKISEISDVKLQEIAKQVDNGDGVLKRKEYALFAQEASKQGVDAKAIGDALDMNGLQRWWYDVDKVSTDGKDDGKLSFWDGAKSYAKGLFGGLVKNIVKNPLESLITIGAFAGGLAVLGLVASPLIAAGVGVAAGIGFGAAALVKGINQTRNAKTDGEAKMGLENAGTGTSMIALSGFGLKGLLSKMKAKSVKPVESVKPKEEVVADNITDDQIRVIGEETPRSSNTAEVDTKLQPTRLTEMQKAKAMTLTELQRKATLDKAGFTEDVISQLKNEKFSYGQQETTLDMVVYLEGEIAKGREITPALIREAIEKCDGRYAQGGYGSKYQREQLEILNKYWSRAEEVRAAYHKDGRFFTEGERLATEAATRKATLDKAGFTEDVISQLKNEKFSYGQQETTLDMVVYLEGEIAKGRKITPALIREAISKCDGIYAQGDIHGGYGSLYQDEQLGALAKYWVHGKELMEIYK